MKRFSLILISFLLITAQVQGQSVKEAIAFNDFHDLTIAYIDNLYFDFVDAYDNNASITELEVKLEALKAFANHSESMVKSKKSYHARQDKMKDHTLSIIRYFQNAASTDLEKVMVNVRKEEDKTITSEDYDENEEIFTRIEDDIRTNVQKFVVIQEDLADYYGYKLESSDEEENDEPGNGGIAPHIH